MSLIRLSQCLLGGPLACWVKMTRWLRLIVFADRPPAARPIDEVGADIDKFGNAGCLRRLSQREGAIQVDRPGLGLGGTAEESRQVNDGIDSGNGLGQGLWPKQVA